MNTVDSLFYKDFKKMMTLRANMGLDINIHTLAEVQSTKTAKNMGYIKKITEPFYEKLNRTYCEIIFKTKVGKPQVKADGTIRLDEQGNEVLDHIPVPRECVLIKTSVNIQLRKKVEDGSDYEEKEHFRYIRYIDKRVEGSVVRNFYYIVPREYVYRVNMMALIITKNRRKNYYNGVKVALVDGSFAYLYTAPLKGVREDTVVMAVGATTDFSAQLWYIVRLWMEKGYVFNYDLCTVELQDKGEFNVAYQLQAPSLYHEDYVPYKTTLKEEQDLTVID